ncbi:MAG: energy transducer TonB, partial [Gammaproteobacteria bacterium]|nr:energy transducer TonB [Gammaproteobacteria bacterium]
MPVETARTQPDPAPMKADQLTEPEKSMVAQVVRKSPNKATAPPIITIAMTRQEVRWKIPSTSANYIQDKDKPLSRHQTPPVSPPPVISSKAIALKHPTPYDDAGSTTQAPIIHKLPDNPRQQSDTPSSSDVARAMMSGQSSSASNNSHSPPTGGRRGEQQPDGRDYSRLLALLHGKISRHQRYPGMARRQRRQGTVTVGFNLYPDGNLGEVDIMHSSGFRPLDREAL